MQDSAKVTWHWRNLCTETCQVISLTLCIILEQRAEWVKRENKNIVEGSEVSVEIILALDGREWEYIRQILKSPSPSPPQIFHPWNFLIQTRSTNHAIPEYNFGNSLISDRRVPPECDWWEALCEQITYVRGTVLVRPPYRATLLRPQKQVP